MQSSEFEKALIDVRKAYRLLYLYQKRILDLVQFMGDSLSFRYEGGWTWFSDSSPRGGSGSLENWAWDWLNMYFYEFNFTVKEINQSEITFSIIIQSDTGFYDSISTSTSQLDIDSFYPAESSSTRLIFLIGKNCWHTDFKKDFEDSSSFYKSNSDDYIKKLEDKTLLAKAFDLKEFINLDTTLNCLEKWVTFCHINGVTEISLSK